MPHQLSLNARQCAREPVAQGTSVKKTVECLHKENIFPCRQPVWRFRGVKISTDPLKYCEAATKLTDEVLQVIDNAMQKNDETTASELPFSTAAAACKPYVTRHNPEKADIGWLDFQLCLLST